MADNTLEQLTGQDNPDVPKRTIESLVDETLELMYDTRKCLRANCLPSLYGLPYLFAKDYNKIVRHLDELNQNRKDLTAMLAAEGIKHDYIDYDLSLKDYITTSLSFSLTDSPILLFLKFGGVAQAYNLLWNTEKELYKIKNMRGKK